MIVTRTLSNGIRTVIESVPNVRSAALGIYVETGSAYEMDRNNGISHMIEHMMFKGTINRSGRDIAMEAALLGDDMNAYTAKEVTCYYARILDEHLPVMAEILGDMFCNSLFDEEELEKEKGVILDEIDMYEDSPEDMVQEQLQKLVWDSHPLGYIISGTEENVRCMTRKELMEFWKEHYVAEQMIISVAGHVETEAVCELLEKCFGSIPGGRKQKEGAAPVYQPARKWFQKEIEQVHVCIGFPGISHIDDKSYTLSVANNIIGGSSSSRLFQQIREEQGLCYSLYSYGSSYHQTGTFQIYCGMNEENLEPVCKSIMECLQKLKQEGPTEEELNQSLSQIRSELLLSMENTHNRMHNNARNLLYMGRIVTIEETLDALRAVTRADIMNYMEEYCRLEQLSMTLVGDVEKSLALKKIMQSF
ncbi:MAG: insulinase family protein [Lachnospiraceae bacterium]|nr:insulinase family protein [Lachnospiraceae bacterium]